MPSLKLRVPGVPAAASESSWHFQATNLRRSCLLKRRCEARIPSSLYTVCLSLVQYYPKSPYTTGDAAFAIFKNDNDQSMHLISMTARFLRSRSASAPRLPRISVDSDGSRSPAMAQGTDISRTGYRTAPYRDVTSARPISVNRSEPQTAETTLKWNYQRSSPIQTSSPVPEFYVNSVAANLLLLLQLNANPSSSTAMADIRDWCLLIDL